MDYKERACVRFVARAFDHSPNGITCLPVTSFVEGEPGNEASCRKKGATTCPHRAAAIFM